MKSYGAVSHNISTIKGMTWNGYFNLAQCPFPEDLNFRAKLGKIYLNFFGPLNCQKMSEPY